MSDLIALHWGIDEITAVLPGRGNDVQAVTLSRPEALASDPTALGRWLKGELATRRIAAKRADVILPRSAAVLRKLSLPSVPEDELPDVVRMQAATKSPTPLDRLRLDFVPLPRRGEGWDVLMATVAGRTIDDVSTSLRTAGLEPSVIGLSSFGCAAKIAGNEPTLIVAVQQTSAEITVARSGSVLMAHATDLPGGDLDEDRQWLSSEISRAVVAADHLEAGGRIDRIVLVGPQNLLEPLGQSLADRYDGKTELVFDVAGLGVATRGGDVDVAALAAALGQLASGGPPRLDFLNPRKRIEKPDRRRLRIGLAVGGVAAALITAYGVSWGKQNALQNEIDFLNTESARLAQEIKLGQPSVDAMNAIDGWKGGQKETGEVLALLNEALPGTDRLYFTKLVLEPAGRNDKGRITGEGAARTRYDIEVEFQGSLARMGLLAPAATITPSGRDAEYPQKFNVTITIPRPAAVGGNGPSDAPAGAAS